MSEHSTDPIPNIPADGWDWFDKQETEAKTIMEHRLGMSIDEIADNFRKCFTTPAGQVVLQYMDIFANDVRDFDPNLGFYNGAAFGFWRSGQKSFMAMIKTFLHRKPQPKTRAKGKQK